MTRSESREAAFLLLFESSFEKFPDSEEILMLAKEYRGFFSDDYSEKVFRGVLEKIQEIDDIIDKYSTKWKASRLPKVSLCALRIAIFEINNMDDVPTASAINEAVELVKRYDDENSSKYINGVLGTYVRDNDK